MSMLMKAPCIMVLCGCVLSELFAQSSTPQGRQSTEAGGSETGQQLYVAYCASCHGTDGKGHGEVSSWLKVPTADLTTLAERNNGRFPYQQVFSVVAGDTSTATHGSKDMPVWGPIFLIQSSRSASDARARINSVVQYIRSMQCSSCD